MAEWPHDIAVTTEAKESKSPMKYAVDYRLFDEDGHEIEDTDYFLTKEEAWDRLEHLTELSGLEGLITIRKL